MCNKYPLVLFFFHDITWDKIMNLGSLYEVRKFVRKRIVENIEVEMRNEHKLRRHATTF